MVAAAYAPEVRAPGEMPVSSRGLDDLAVSGFEDADTRNLLNARAYLRKANMPTLRPVLPLFLRLKGKPYSLHNYFPFEPFFRTRMPGTVLLKTGRQVAKCLDEDEPILMRSGRRMKAKDLRVGDVIMSWSKTEKKFVPRKVTRIWKTGRKAVNRIATETGFTCRVTPEHRLLVRDGDNHNERFVAASDIYRGDYLGVQGKAGKVGWERVIMNRPDGEADTLDLEVEAETDDDHNFVLGKCVSHNSTSLAAQGIVFSNSMPYFSTLYVTPLFEMIRRFSHGYVREFLETSPVKRLFLGANTMNSVLQRTYRNGASMYFSYAFLDAERTRGIPADKNVIDEIQDMNFDFLQIIHETLSGSKWGLKQYAGTPKSLDNTMERLWQDSSQAEWVIKCRAAGCGHFNIPTDQHDLYRMIGKWHSEISEKSPGVTCSQCMKPLEPRTGRWVHAFPERRWSFAGYHVPQIIMPLHYADQEKWLKLVGKFHGVGNVSPTTFLNEVCGLSSDSGAKLVTVTDLKQACCLGHPNKALEAAKKTKKYMYRVLSIDWGGGGGRLRKGNAQKKDGDVQRLRTSFTTLAVLGVLHDGSVECIWGMRSKLTHDWLYEAQLSIEAMKIFKCSHLVHDFSNAGEGRMIFLKQAGLPARSIVNMRYHGILHHRMEFHDATEDNPYPYYSLDKSQTLATTCLAIKTKMLRFFNYDYHGSDDPGLLQDFLALIEEKVENRMGTDVTIITKNPNMSDDFAHSVNMGAHALWWMAKKWPNFAGAAKFKIPAAVLAQMHPTNKPNWDDL